MFSFWFRIFIFLFLCAIQFCEATEIISSDTVSVDVTIYRADSGSYDLSDPDAEARGIALISEVREVDLPAGDVLLKFERVAETIVPQSVRIDTEAAFVKELNFDYKMISPGDIIFSSIGQQVKVERIHPKTGKVELDDAKLIANEDGVLVEVNGKVEPLDCGGEHKKIIFDRLPPELNATPQLSANLKVEKPGRIKIRLTYLATGFDWVANYVLKQNDDNKTLSLLGWLTLVNKQNLSFKNATVSVVAGKVNRDDSTEPEKISVTPRMKTCWYENKFHFLNKLKARHSALFSVSDQYNYDAEEVIVTGIKASVAKQLELGDYKIYQAPFLTDIDANQVKQIKILIEPAVKFEKIYEYEFGREDNEITQDELEVNYDSTFVESPVQVIRLQNKKSEGLGEPIPQGRFSAFGRLLNSTNLSFTGEWYSEDTPVGLPIDVKMGQSDEVDIQPFLIKKNDEKNNKAKQVHLVFKMTSHKKDVVVVEIKPDVGYYSYKLSEAKLIRESATHYLKDGVPVWRFKIKPEEEKQLNVIWSVKTVD